MSTLPTTWIETNLGTVVPYGATVKAEPEDLTPDTWVLELEDIEKDTTKVLQRLTFSVRQSKSTKNRFDAGDVLYGKLRPYLNKVAFADQPGVCTTEIVPIKPNDAVNGRYLFHWLRHPKFLVYVTKVSHGVNMPRLGTEAGRQAPFVLAPKNEQKRIADKLDTLLARVDAVNTRLARVAPILKRFRQSVLAAATSGRLTEDWREQCEAESRRTFALSDLAVSIDQGWSPKCNADAAPPDRWAVIKTTAIQALHFYPEENKALPNDLNPRPNLALADGDVLITRAGPRSRAGIACVVKGDHPMLMLCDKAYRVRVDRSKVLPQMLNLLLNSPETLAVIDGMKTGISESGVNLTQAKFRELALSVPRIAEQAEIVRRVETLFAFADRLETRLHAAQSATERMTPALLAKAFRGELVPQDSNDEPASELLRRLQQEAPSTSTKRGRKSAA